MIPSRSGQGYCVPCAAPADDVPLVPATWSVKRFLQIASAYERGVREYNQDVRKWRRYLAPGSKPGSLRVVTEERADPTEAEEFEIPLVRVHSPRRASRAGGRPRKLAAGDVEKLRRMTRTPGFTATLLAERFNTSPRTIRRYLGQLGLKLKKRPAQRARRP